MGNSQKGRFQTRRPLEIWPPGICFYLGRSEEEDEDEAELEDIRFGFLRNSPVSDQCSHCRQSHLYELRRCRDDDRLTGLGGSR